MSEFRDTTPGARSREAQPAPGTAGSEPTGRTHTEAREPLRDDDRFEHERIGLHNEAETIRRDRIRWGPVWAGIVTTVGSYLFLQLVLVATGIVDLADSPNDTAIASGIAALIAFFLGGLTTGATAMWQGVDDGIIHGIVMWFAALVVVIAFSAFGSGVALGSFDTSDVFDEVSLENVDIGAASDEAQEAAAWALLAFSLGLIASAAGGALGAKLWPKDDVYVDVWRRKERTTR